MKKNANGKRQLTIDEAFHSKKAEAVEPPVVRKGQLTLPAFGINAPKYGGYLNPYAPKKTKQLRLSGKPPLYEVCLAVVGSREFKDEKRGALVIRNFIDWLLRERNMQVVRITSGHAAGADTIGENFAVEQVIPFDGFPPDPGLPVPQRYFQRNQQIVDACDVVLALWDEKSRGTQDTLRRARKKSIPVYVYNFVRPEIMWSEYAFKLEN